MKRNSALLKSIDLYDLLINGDTSFNIGLRTGDTIVVRPSLSRYICMEEYQSQQYMSLKMRMLEMSLIMLAVHYIHIP